MIAFRALTTSVRVSVADNVVYRDLVEHIVAAYEQTDDGELRYDLTSQLHRDDDLLPCDPPDVVRRFEHDLYTEVIARAAPGWILHAAALDIGGRALVLCGPSGAGKTTLTLALVGRGLKLLTDEAVWISSSGQVRGLARPFHIADADADARIPAAWPRYAYPLSGGETSTPLAVPPRDVYRHGELPLHAIVRIGHGPDWPVYLRESPPTLAMERLWNRSLRQNDASLVTATQILSRHRTYELSRRTEPEALSLLESLLK